jgi:hypothetical protein
MLAEVLIRLRADGDCDGVDRDGVDRDGGNRQEIATTAFLMMQLIAATVRLAISVERDEAAALLATFKRMMLRDSLLAA